MKIKDFNMDADKDGTNDAFDTNGDGTADLVPTWITRIITGKGNDLAYLITTLNKKLLDEATTVSETFDVSVKTELKNLKTEIEKTDASVDQKNTN
ncbi:MAG: hypothetical protein WCG98_09695, partial [bacterium]